MWVVGRSREEEHICKSKQHAGKGKFQGMVKSSRFLQRSLWMGNVFASPCFLLLSYSCEGTKSKISFTELKSRCHRLGSFWRYWGMVVGGGEIHSFPCPASGGNQHSLLYGHITPISTSAVTWPSSISYLLASLL